GAPRGPGDPASRDARRSLIHALSQVDHDRHLKHMLTLMKAPEADAREAAARALRNMPSPEAVKALGEALWDGDRMVRYWAIQGLARITRIRGHAPFWSIYEPDEDKHLSFWRKWYEEVGKPGVEEPEGAQDE
ncbi:MAG: HEAT repeat domain-containing protein, partial [Armatimonadota bacterium]